ncbi:MAG: DUF2971 domain-containing protein [Spirochaetes bacterium]|nr:DUF2971 domain-containing protein [Spirochaetota bacterium]
MNNKKEMIINKIMLYIKNNSFLMEYLRKDFTGLKNLSIPEKIYHYTNINSLKGILENKEFWASQAEYLNDKSELKYFWGIYENILESRQNEHDLLKKNYKELIKNKKDLVQNLYIYPRKHFILSFSIDSDSFPLWSIYSKSCGYNLGINVNELLEIIKSNNQFDSTFEGLIIYEEARQKEIINIEIDEFLQLFSKCKDNKEQLYLDIIFKEKMKLLSLFFKQNCFECEKEFRIVVIVEKNNNLIQHRTKENSLIPFCKW